MKLTSRLALTLLTLFVLLLGSTSYLYNRVVTLPEQPLSLSEPALITVPKGFNGAKLNQLLQERAWLNQPTLLKLLFKIQPELAEIRAGEYRIEPGETLGELLSQLREGRSILYPLTLIEGSTVKELLKSLAANDLIEHTLSANSAESLAEELDLDFESAEGLFLAETYHFMRGESDRTLLLRAHEALNQSLNEQWQQREAGLPLENPYQALILASIVEKETGLVAERAKIAGVFMRRLERNIRLQTDPTVIYGLGDQYAGNLTRKHLKQPTPYNTYVIKGLPPTPIALVGADAIRAVMHPEQGSELYFVAKGDGSHQFSDTLQQHNKAVRQFQLKRRSDYRSSPEAN